MSLPTLPNFLSDPFSKLDPDHNMEKMGERTGVNQNTLGFPRKLTQRGAKRKSNFQHIFSSAFSIEWQKEGAYIHIGFALAAACERAPAAPQNVAKSNPSLPTLYFPRKTPLTHYSLFPAASPKSNFVFHEFHLPNLEGGACGLWGRER